MRFIPPNTGSGIWYAQNKYLRKRNMEGGKEAGREGITLPKQIPRVEEILLKKHGLTRNEASGPITSFGPF